MGDNHWHFNRSTAATQHQRPSGQIGKGVPTYFRGWLGDNLSVICLRWKRGSWFSLLKWAKKENHTYLTFRKYSNRKRNWLLKHWSAIHKSMHCYSKSNWWSQGKIKRRKTNDCPARPDWTEWCVAVCLTVWSVPWCAWHCAPFVRCSVPHLWW